MSTSLLFELGSVAGKAIKAGIAEYNRDPQKASTGSLAVVVLREVGDWKPTVKGKMILTGPLKSSLASALAGLAYNIAAADAGRGLV